VAGNYLIVVKDIYIFTELERGHGIAIKEGSFSTRNITDVEGILCKQSMREKKLPDRSHIV